MSRIDIRHPHSLPKAKARKAIEDVAKKLAEKFDMDYGWDGDILNFSRSGVDGAIELAGALRKPTWVVASQGLALSCASYSGSAEMKGRV